MSTRRMAPRLVLSCLVAAVLLGPTAVGASAGTTTDPATIAARQKFFGAENVDPETGAMKRGEVHLSWVSVATFAAALDGHVVLLDAYIHKGEDVENYVPATTQDLIDLAPEYIILGHGHFDHAVEAGPIAAATGATVIGTEHHCSNHMELSGVAFDCVGLFADDAVPGDTTEVELWDGVCTTAVLHVHSAAEPPDPNHPPQNTVIFTPDPGSILLHPPGAIPFTDQGGDEGGTVLYQLRMGDFSLTYHDSTGPLKEQAPGVFDVLRGLPNTDVEIGAILGFNQITNGLRDPAMYAEAIDAQVYIPAHHDFITEYGSADEFEPVLVEEFAFYGADPELRFLYDPYDYVRPNLLSYDIDAPRWKEPGDEVCVRAATSDVTASGVVPAPLPDRSGGGLAATGASGLLAVLGGAGIGVALQLRRRRLA